MKEGTKPLILVTNDDSITAPGIAALIAVAKRHGEVVVVAPDKPQSGQGHAITLNQPLRLVKMDMFDGVESYQCSGTPVDCVKLAKNIILKDRAIDLCISGINHGSNASINIIYSGTMSAAMEASLENIDSIGFSLDNFAFEADFSQAQIVAEQIITQVLKNGLPSPCQLLNVNIPKGPVRGLKVCKQTEGVWVEEFQEATHPRGEKYYWMTGKYVKNDDHPLSDIDWLEKGYATVVPSYHDLTHYASMQGLEYLEKLTY